MITEEDFRHVTLIDPPILLGPHDQFQHMMEIEFKFAMSQVNDAGLFLEFGVFKGNTINICAKLKPHIIFHGFDSFEGLPEEWDLVGDTGHNVSKIKVKPAGHFKVDQLPKVENNVKLYKGWFTDSLPIWKNEHLNTHSFISFLHIDSDLYSSAIYVLEELNDYIKPGTIIRFDELVEWRLTNLTNKNKHAIPKPKYAAWREGEYKALNEWIQKDNREVQPIWRNWHEGAGIKVIK
jgi:hypothetical protein